MEPRGFTATPLAHTSSAPSAALSVVTSASPTPWARPTSPAIRGASAHRNHVTLLGLASRRQMATQ